MTHDYTNDDAIYVDDNDRGSISVYREQDLALFYYEPAEQASIREAAHRFAQQRAAAYGCEYFMNYEP